MKSLLFFLGKLSVSVLLIYIALRGIDFDQIQTLLLNISMPLAILACIVMFASHSLGMMEWRVFLYAQRLRIPWMRCLAYYYTGQFFNNFLISNIGGDMVRLVDVAHGERARAGRVFASIMADRVFGLACLFMLGLCALPGFAVSGDGGFVLHIYMFFALFMLVFWLIVFSRRLCFLAMRFTQYIPIHRLRRLIFQLLRVFVCYRRNPKVFLRAFFWGMCNQIVKMSVSFLALASLGGFEKDIPIHAVMLFVPILGVVKILPISIMGIGPHEFAGQRLFALVGVAGDFALSFLFLNQIIAIVSNIACGIFVFMRGGSRHR
ncbi:MAG: flippase-like domain-containing protein [Spirochaetota bacterium]|nr:flippase-like domain-containing protein [Spirochaetota bacterium]